MQGSKEQPGEIREPSSAINAKRQRKTVKWERLEKDLFKKIRDTKGTFHAKMGSIKNRNGMDLTEAEDIKQWQEYTEELYKKIFRTQTSWNVRCDHSPRARDPGM